MLAALLAHGASCPHDRTGAGQVSAPAMSTRRSDPYTNPCTSPKLLEDEFELVMGLFEKVTHEKTDFLHHVCHCITHSHAFNTDNLYLKGLEQGSPFSPFSEYQDTFSVPSWIPPSQQLIRFTKAIYPYWKEHCIESGGVHIIPTLNVSLMLHCIYLYLR